MNLGKVKNVKVIKDENIKILSIGEVVALEIKDKFVPSLMENSIIGKLPAVIVDMGAVKPLCNGANLMRPGIKKFEGDFKKGDIVAVKEEKYGKYIAIGLSLMDKEEAERINKGLVLENLHYVGDKAWEKLKELKVKGIIE